MAGDRVLTPLLQPMPVPQGPAASKLGLPGRQKVGSQVDGTQTMIPNVLALERGLRAGGAVGRLYKRLAAAIRAIDPEHILSTDGNTYSTEFDFFGEPLDNTVYTLHDYVPAG